MNFAYLAGFQARQFMDRPRRSENDQRLCIGDERIRSPSKKKLYGYTKAAKSQHHFK